MPIPVSDVLVPVSDVPIPVSDVTEQQPSNSSMYGFIRIPFCESMEIPYCLLM